MFSRLTKEQKIAAKATNSVRCSAVAAITDRPERRKSSTCTSHVKLFHKINICWIGQRLGLKVPSKFLLDEGHTLSFPEPLQNRNLLLFCSSGGHNQYNSISEI